MKINNKIYEIFKKENYLKMQKPLPLGWPLLDGKKSDKNRPKSGIRSF